MLRIYFLIFCLLFLFIYNIFFPSKEGLSLASIGNANADLSQNQKIIEEVDKFYETLPNFFDKKIKISGTDIKFTYKDGVKDPSGCHKKDNGKHNPSTYECETYEIGNMEDKIMSKKGIQQWFKPLIDRLDVKANKIISDSK